MVAQNKKECYITNGNVQSHFADKWCYSAWVGVVTHHFGMLQDPGC